MCIDQFFSENAADQENVLSAFLDLLSGYDTILTFNGIGFDIPYLKAKCKTLHLSDPFDAHSYIDLYKEVSRFKFLFALTSYKQKSIELFLGIDRIDAYSGGELIEVYKEYVRHPAKDSLALLKQHNYEDVLYMPKLLPVLSYPKLWEKAFSLQSLQASEYRSMDGVSGNKELFFTLALQYPVPKPVSFSYDDCYLSMSGSTARCVCVSSRENCASFTAAVPRITTISPKRISQFTRALLPPSTRNTACRRTPPTATAKNMPSFFRSMTPCFPRCSVNSRAAGNAILNYPRTLPPIPLCRWTMFCIC